MFLPLFFKLVLDRRCRNYSLSKGNTSSARKKRFFCTGVMLWSLPCSEECIAGTFPYGGAHFPRRFIWLFLKERVCNPGYVDFPVLSKHHRQRSQHTLTPWSYKPFFIVDCWLRKAIQFLQEQQATEYSKRVLFVQGALGRHRGKRSMLPKQNQALSPERIRAEERIFIKL